MIEKSQRIAARIVGITYPLMFVVATGAFFRFYAPLLAGNDVAQTVRNILAHERDFRIYIAATLIYGVGMVVLLTALYVILRPVGRGLALFAAFLQTGVCLSVVRYDTRFIWRFAGHGRIKLLASI